MIAGAGPGAMGEGEEAREEEAALTTGGATRWLIQRIRVSRMR